MELTRRGLLAGTAGGSLAWAVATGADRARGAGAGATWATLPLGADGAARPPARTRVGADGVTEIEVVATPLPADHPMRPLVVAGYADGVAGTPPTVPGPTIVMPPGQRLRVVLRNLLDEETSLHLHGLRISPGTDAPFATVAPGATRAYDVTTPPMQVGTYWYHPHVHGLVEPQMSSGLTGGMTMDLPVKPDVVTSAASALLVLTTLQNEQEVLVNGLREPRITLASSWARLRLVNTSVSRRLVLRLVAGGRVVGGQQVASDSGWLEHPVDRGTLELSPGERMETLVSLPAGDVQLLALDPDGGDPVLLATLSAAVAVPVPHSTARLASLPRRLPGPHVRTRRITFGLGPGGTFAIDGRRFDHQRTDVRVRRGSTEVWELVNTTDLEHPFHLHSYPFQVLSRGGRREQLVAWRDVTVLRPHETVRVIIPFHGYAGRTVFHCHNVTHEDAGMMATVLVS